MSSAPQPSTLRAVLGIWSDASTSTSAVNIDLEAQIITGTRISYSPSAPAAAVAHTARIQPEEGTDPIDDFFGVTRSHTGRSHARMGTQDSRHDDPHAFTHQEFDVPPPYADASDLPSYTSVAEPPTLAMYFFKFGFLFPLFWLAGAIILFSPLNAPEDWEHNKTEEERQELIELLRRTETRWARRCLVAFALFAIFALALVLSLVLVLKS